MDPQFAKSLLEDPVVKTQFQEQGLSATVPEINSANASLALTQEEVNGSFTIGLEGAKAVEINNGMPVSKSEGVLAAAQLTEDLGGQMVAIVHDPSKGYVDFKYELPEGYFLRSDGNGGYSLISPSGAKEGSIEPGWAYDANGTELETSYQLVDGRTLRQTFASEDAAFPVTLDPSWT